MQILINFIIKYYSSNIESIYFYIQLTISVAAPGFWFWGNIGQNFTHEFHSSPVLQWHRQNFSSGGGTFSKNVLIKDF